MMLEDIKVSDFPKNPMPVPEHVKNWKLVWEKVPPSQEKLVVRGLPSNYYAYLFHFHYLFPPWLELTKPSNFSLCTTATCVTRIRCSPTRGNGVFITPCSTTSRPPPSADGGATERGRAKRTTMTGTQVETTAATTAPLRRSARGKIRRRKIRSRI